MRFSLALIGIVALGLIGWGCFDWFLLAPAADADPAFIEATALARGFAGAKVMFGFLVMAVCIGFDETIRAIERNRR